MQSNMNQAQYQTMMAARGMPNGVAPNDLKRAAAMNRNPYVVFLVTLRLPLTIGVHK